MLDPFGIVHHYPTISGGKTWYSTAWNNGHIRRIKECKRDPYDNAFEYSDGTPTSPIVINGDGIASCSAYSTSYRLYVEGPWLNTEVTAMIKIRGSARNVQLHSRSSHQLKGMVEEYCKFAGYLHKWDIKLNQSSVECEILDQIICRHLDEKKMSSIPLNKWVCYKQTTRTKTESGKVLVSGYINLDDSPDSLADLDSFPKSSEFIFDGTNATDYDVLNHPDDRYHHYWRSCLLEGNPPATDLVQYSAWLKPEQMCWIRLDNCTNVDFKNLSVREIKPLP